MQWIDCAIEWQNFVHPLLYHICRTRITVTPCNSHFDIHTYHSHILSIIHQFIIQKIHMKHTFKIHETKQTATSNQGQQQKHDIFVGNLAFSTTEEQLQTVFSEIGRVIKVRMVSDLETGKPRGFAFVEFEDPQAALSAIRNMNDYELNGRRLRVNFSNSSHLETLAGQLGMDMSKKDAGVSIAPGSTQHQANAMNTTTSSRTAHGHGHQGNMDVGTQAVANALKNMSKGEMYDVIAKLKQIADGDPDEARKMISGHPQLPEAILFLMSQLDMIRAPLPNGMGVPANAGPLPVPMGVPMPMPPPPPEARKDPRARHDPRARQDPRAAPPMQVQVPPVSSIPPPMNPPYMGHPAPAPPVPPPSMGVAGLDPALVQQVMGLTPEQIQQLPVEKQSSILALRQQITNAMTGR